jgi:hypothetical protein
MKQISRRGPTSIRRHRTKFSRHGDVAVVFVHPCDILVLMLQRSVLADCFAVFQDGKLFPLRGDPREAPECSAVQGK